MPRKLRWRFFTILAVVLACVVGIIGLPTQRGLPAAEPARPHPAGSRSPGWDAPHSAGQHRGRAHHRGRPGGGEDQVEFSGSGDLLRGYPPRGRHPDRSPGGGPGPPGRWAGPDRRGLSGLATQQSGRLFRFLPAEPAAGGGGTDPPKRRAGSDPEDSQPRGRAGGHRARHPEPRSRYRVSDPGPASRGGRLGAGARHHQVHRPARAEDRGAAGCLSLAGRGPGAVQRRHPRGQGVCCRGFPSSGTPPRPPSPGTSPTDRRPSPGETCAWPAPRTTSSGDPRWASV